MIDLPSYKKQIDCIVLDDEADLCFMMQAILKSKGFSVLHITDAAQLDVLLQTYHPKVLIIDLQLGEYDGSIISKNLIQDKSVPPLKILLISASFDGLQKATACGADDFLEKPFGIKEFEAKVISLLPMTELSLSS